MIIFDRITKRYGADIVALPDVFFKIEGGGFLSLVGKSGAGKSTLLKLLSGEEHPTEGKVLFRETDVAALKPHELPAHRRRIGAVFPDFRLLTARPVAENVAFALEGV